jgi:hypothetical protein
MISANSLFHFTKSIENIQNILSNNFIPNYCLERFNNSNLSPEIAIPMVCFCDIPLSQILGHIDNYGNYAIGLKKEWAFSKGISPVFYIYNDSYTDLYLKKLIDFGSEIVNANNFHDTFEQLVFLEFICFCKKYKGNFLRGNELLDEIIFYNEREWRYVPSIQKIKELNPNLFLSKPEYSDETKKKRYNGNMKLLKLEFEPKDINYIVISNEDERLQIINLIEEIKGDKFSLNEIKRLNSKIISVEQIKNDF